MRRWLFMTLVALIKYKSKCENQTSEQQAADARKASSRGK